VARPPAVAACFFLPEVVPDALQIAGSGFTSVKSQPQSAVFAVVGRRRKLLRRRYFAAVLR
jgi:hypothetical protein